MYQFGPQFESLTLPIPTNTKIEDFLSPQSSFNHGIHTPKDVTFASSPLDVFAAAEIIPSPLPPVPAPSPQLPASAPPSFGFGDVRAIDAAIAPGTPKGRFETGRLVWCEICDVCGKQFFKQGSLLRHKRAAHRTGRRRARDSNMRLDCPLCPKTFSQQGSLNRHLRSIHESRKLHCQYCNLAFGQAFDLKRHQRRKHPHATPVVPREALPVLMPRKT